MEKNKIEKATEGRKFTKEYIESRIREQKKLTKKELKELTPELKLYYNELYQLIKGLEK